MKAINTNIKYSRKALKMTQSQLAEKLGYADKRMIAKIEAGLVNLPQSRIEMCIRDRLSGDQNAYGIVTDSRDRRFSTVCERKCIWPRARAPGGTGTPRRPYAP